MTTHFLLLCIAALYILTVSTVAAFPTENKAMKISAEKIFMGKIFGFQNTNIVLISTKIWDYGKDTKTKAYDVVNYKEYVVRQSEAAVRHLANSFPYDNLEDEHADIPVRIGADKVNEILENELTERLAPAGIVIMEARISHLAYAPEIAGASLQRQ